MPPSADFEGRRRDPVADRDLPERGEPRREAVGSVAAILGARRAARGGRLRARRRRRFARRRFARKTSSVRSPLSPTASIPRVRARPYQSRVAGQVRRSPGQRRGQVPRADAGRACLRPPFVAKGRPDAHFAALAALAHAALAAPLFVAAVFAPGAAAAGEVTGTVAYRERMALPPNARVHRGHRGRRPRRRARRDARPDHDRGSRPAADPLQDRL